MADIVERLRAGKLVSKDEAAAEIERLRAENAQAVEMLNTHSAEMASKLDAARDEAQRLRAALREIVEPTWGNPVDAAEGMDRIARDALEPRT